MNETEGPQVEIFSDGACSGNPGPGGWGTILRFGGHEKELSGYDAETTNNRMELSGAIAGLEALTRPCRVRITTDSEYVKKGMTEWIDGWVKRGWKNTQKKPVANRDLWEPLIAEVRPRDIVFTWVKGHAGDEWNDLADRLAVEAGFTQQPRRGDERPTKPRSGLVPVPVRPGRRGRRQPRGLRPDEPTGPPR
jgi:ribonuclease HI